MHHIIADGWSLQVLARDLLALYGSFDAQAAPELPELKAQYADYALWHEAWLASGERQQQLDYWKNRLSSNYPILELPADHPRRDTPSFRGKTHHVELALELASGLRAVSRERDVTLFVLLLGAFCVVASQRSGRSRYRIGTDCANRGQLETEDVVGFFVNQAVLDIAVEPDSAALPWLALLQADVVEAIEHQDLPFDHLVKALAPARRHGQSPFFGIKVIYQEVGQRTLSLPELEVVPVTPELHGAELDLVVGFSAGRDRLEIDLQYATDLFEPETMRVIEAQLVAVLQQIVAAPESSIQELLALARGVEQHAAHTRSLEAAAHAQQAELSARERFPIKPRAQRGR
jgi:non-ribosomal peptide synthetase component F